MKLFKISCTSDCGSYFTAYLQSISVAAPTREAAIKAAKAWMAENHENFIYPENRWEVYEMTPNAQGVFDTVMDSDY